MAPRRMLAAALVVGGAVIPSARLASAAEVSVGAETTVDYDTNVARTSTNETDDGSVRAGPTLRLKEPDGDLTYELFYRPMWHQYFTVHGISGMEQYALGKLDWRPSARSELSVSDTFYVVPTVQQQFISSNALGNPTYAPGNNKYLLNDATVQGGYLFTQRLRGVLTLTSSIYEPKQKSETPSQSASGDLSLLYALTPNARVGGGFNFTNQNYQPDVGQDTTTRFYQGYALAEYDFDPTWTFSLNAGPAWVDASQPDLSGTSTTVATVPLTSNGQPISLSTCPRASGAPILDTGCQNSSTSFATQIQNALIAAGAPNDLNTAIEAFNLSLESNPAHTVTTAGPQPSGSGGQLTYFAAATLRKRWETVTGSLSYSRNANSASGYGASNVLDSVIANAEWTPTQLWTLVFTARLDQRKTAADQAVLRVGFNPAGFAIAGTSQGTLLFPDIASSQDLRTVLLKNSSSIGSYTLYGTVFRKLTKRLTAFGRVSWYQQSTQGDFSSANDYKDFIVSLGLRFELEPWKIPPLD